MESQSRTAQQLARHPVPTPPAPPAQAGLPLGRDLRAAARDVAGVCPGMFLLGVTFGLVVVHAGLAWWWTPLFSGLIFGGSLEFLLIVMAEAAAPLAAIALTSLLVQGRHIFYALSFPLHHVSGKLRRTYAMFALIDEAYALTTARPADELTSTRILAMQILMHASWVGGGVAGALAGTSLPAHVPALDFMFTALFVVLAAEASLTGRTLTDPLLALACALAARAAAPGQMLLLAMGMYCALLLLLRLCTDRTRHA
jgi:4-azaleucine resistance transporter AzlC